MAEPRSMRRPISSVSRLYIPARIAAWLAAYKDAKSGTRSGGGGGSGTNASSCRRATSDSSCLRAERILTLPSATASLPS
eukprot:4683070-Prymnesium_polylepis.1